MKPPRKKKEQDRKSAQAANKKSNSVATVFSTEDAGSSTPKNAPPSHLGAAKSESQAMLTVSCGEYSDKESAQEENKFTRRSIVSNWDRYKEIQDHDKFNEEDTEAMGQDFLSLLTDTGGASTQFRLKDELEWEESGDSELLDNFQNLNLDDLALSLSCIPLPERLGLESRVFLEEQITEFDDMAYANRQIFYKLKMQDQTAAKPCDDMIPNPVPPILIGNRPVLSSNIDQSSDRSITLAKENRKTETPLSVNAEMADLEARSHGFGNDKLSGAAAPPEKLEDDLDFLLDMPIKRNTYELTAVAIASPSAQVSLAGDSCPKPITAPLKPEFQLQKQGLDDGWLDSLLED